MRRSNVPRTIALACTLAGVVWMTTACPKQHRRVEDPDPDDGRPSPRVQKQSDPRFPHAADTGNRRGFWVEQPRRTGPVSPTQLANAVTEQLPALRQRCCGADGAACEGLEGRMLLETVVRPNGKVERVEIGETSLYDRSFQTCLVKWANGWSLPSAKMSSTETVYIPIRARFPASDPDQPDAG